MAREVLEVCPCLLVACLASIQSAGAQQEEGVTLIAGCASKRPMQGKPFLNLSPLQRVLQLRKPSVSAFQPRAADDIELLDYLFADRG